MSTKETKATSAAQSLKALLPQVKEQTEIIRATLADLRRQRAGLEAELSALLRVPMRKDDYLALVHAEVDAYADDFAKGVARKLEREQDPPEKRGESTHRFANGRLSLALSHRPENGYLFGCLVGSNDLKFDRWAFLFRDAMKDALSGAFALARWEWEGETVRPLPELRAEHDRLSAAIAELQRQERELIEQAAEIGVSVE
ncbi:MAG: hypothetical protein GXC76_01875 [Rhodanobacteraceae bacterium]|jgi:hypothetical protein|nr:hypothetical protein [Rhodanobacteraceae bacterium]